MEQKTHSGKNKRMASIELLRILAMFMVVMLHYLSKGEVLPALTDSMSANGYVAWILESFSIVAVNVYMLISGFFLVESGFKCKRLVQLLCQVLFYSLLIPLILLSSGILHVEDITVYDLLRYILPAEMVHYWFATAYITMYLFSPVLRTAVKHMGKKQLKYTIIILLLFFSMNKSVIPVRLDMDNMGYDGIWFLCVYLIAAYMRLYGIPFFDKAKKGVLCYLAGCAALLGITILVRVIYLQTGKFEDFIGAAYGYNHILNLFAAISLFYAFYYYRIRWKRLADWVIQIAPYTFGVYLLHEHLELRNIWPGWIGANMEESMVFFILRCAAGVVLVFCIGILADMVRGMLFWIAGGFFAGGRIDRLLARADKGIGCGHSYSHSYGYGSADGYEDETNIEEKHSAKMD